MTPSAEPTSKAEVAAHLVPANLLGDSEIIVLAIKPSGWFVLTASVPVVAAAAVVGVVAGVVGLYRPYEHVHAVLSFCAVAALARMVLACWQWIGRTYVLTNLRIVCVRGLISVDVASAALAEVGEAVLAGSLAERLVGIGSIYCLPASDGPLAVAWTAVARPAETHEVVQEAVRRARRRAERP